MAYILGIWGEAEIILRIWGAMEKYFHGAEEFFFHGFGESNAFFFQGSREHRPPCGLQERRFVMFAENRMFG